MQEWYLGDDWDLKTQAIFEQKLSKSRGSYNKAQFLRIKGSSLIKSKDLQKRTAGCELLIRVTKEYPNELSNVMFAFEQLGDYYFNEKLYEIAELYYRKVIDYYIHHGRSGTSGIADIKLAEIIILSGQIDKYSEMYELLTNEFQKTDGSLLLKEDIFRYNLMLAKICDGLNKNIEAKTHAVKCFSITNKKDQEIVISPIKVNERDLIFLNEILHND